VEAAGEVGDAAAQRPLAHGYFEKRWVYQDGVQNSAFRATPDVSFVADPHTGVAVYTTATGRALWLEVGGTSLSAPVWGALLTTTDQLRATAGKKHLAVAGPDVAAWRRATLSSLNVSPGAPRGRTPRREGRGGFYAAGVVPVAVALGPVPVPVTAATLTV
jgi:hypothetical protein